MTVVDNYIEQAYEAIRSYEPEQKDALAREIIAAFRSEIPGLTHFGGGKVAFGDKPYKPELYGDEALKKLIGILRVYREGKDREDYAKYGLTSMTATIRELEDALYLDTDDEEFEQLFRRIDYSFANDYPSYSIGLGGWGGSRADVQSEAEKRIRKLHELRDIEMRKVLCSASQGGHIDISQTTNANSHAEAYCEVSLVSTMERIDGLSEEKLNDDEKTTLKGILADLAQVKNVDEKKRAEKLGKALRWIGDKSVDVMIAAAPFILQTIQSLG